MAKLSDSHLRFLRDMHVPLDKVFDASGLGKSQYEKIMRDLGMWVAYGVSACRAGGHTLRTRSGHCLQCSPANISYLKRHDEKGQVYVAYSLATKLVKVGTAVDSADRIAHLNSYQYGGASDWLRFYASHCDRAGLIETLSHAKLANHAVSRTYFREGRGIECRELFSCDIDMAIAAVVEAAREKKIPVRVIQDRQRVSAPA